MMSPLLEFESSVFPIIPGEDKETNPGIYGKALAEWICAQLRASGIPAEGAFAEDFGWCVQIQSKPHRLYVACASGDKADQWRVFAFAEGGARSAYGKRYESRVFRIVVRRYSAVS